MAWPDFSELTFAFAFLRELEAHFGPYTTPPNFISQAEEYWKGYDAEVALNGSILFVQFKRSEVMTRATAKEVQFGHFAPPPIFRMHLHKRHAYGQHTALQKLEADGSLVLYATSAAETRNVLFGQAGSIQVVNNSGLFAPSEIVLPDVTHPHHVSFKRQASTMRVYSENGEPAERRVVGVEGLRKLLVGGERDAKQNRRALEKFVTQHSTPQIRRLINNAVDGRAEAPDVLAEAAAVALLRYDLSLLIAKP